MYIIVKTYNISWYETNNSVIGKVNTIEGARQILYEDFLEEISACGFTKEEKKEIFSSAEKDSRYLIDYHDEEIIYLDKDKTEAYINIDDCSYKWDIFKI